MLAGGAPLTVAAQEARKIFHVGILGFGGSRSGPTGPQPADRSAAAFLGGMAMLGYRYGTHFVTESRGPGGNPERLPALAAELVHLKPDVIIAGGGLPAVALKQATTTIPIVMAASVDPVGQGLVQSLARPGGNVTGMSLQSTDTIGKRLELLKELIPGAAPVAALWYRADPTDWQAAQVAARLRGWKLLSIELRDVGEIDAAIKTAATARCSGLLVLGGGVFFPHGRRIAEIAAAHRLPTMFGLRPLVESGGLMSHGADLNDIWRRAATYVDKILKGAKPGDLPVEQPTKFELVINLKTARVLGINVPQALLLWADEVIQ
jgi:putative ABC transport system substrate-binding protein